MSTDILYPLLIGGGCVLLVMAVHRLTRPKPSMADITVPDATGDLEVASPSTDVSLSALTEWHRSHEATVLDFFEHHDALVSAGSADDDPPQDDPPQDDPAEDGLPPLHARSGIDGAGEDETTDAVDTTTAAQESVDGDEHFGDDAFEQALQAHPAPEMRAELAAARAAGTALTLAVEREDSEAVARHREVYVTYRDIWLERLWQFSADADRLAELRSQTIDPS